MSEQIDRAGVEHEQWFVGVMNDCCFIINRTPPRGDYDGGLKVIARIGPSQQNQEAAQFIANTHNTLLDRLEGAEAERDNLRRLLGLVFYSGTSLTTEQAGEILAALEGKG